MSRWRTHLVLLGVLALQAGLWALGHRGEDELRAALASNDPRARIEAQFVRIERGLAGSGPAELEALERSLVEGHPLEAEFAHTTAVCKHLGAVERYAALKERMAAGTIDAAFWRTFVILRRKIGGALGGSSGRLKRQELAWWFEAVDGGKLPADEVLEWIREHP